MLTTLLALATLSMPALQDDARAAAAVTLRGAIAQSRELRAEHTTGLLPLVHGGQAAQLQLGDLHVAERIGALVQEGRWREVTEAGSGAEWLERELLALASDLEFQPVREAELPLGFPEPTPVREIELKQYPQYRAASAAMDRNANGAFWKLFKHIQANDIAMTAPVETTFAESDAGLRTTRMSFLYGEPELGVVGPEGAVEVVDAPPMWVVSLGCRGNDGAARIASAHQELLAWIGNRPELAVAGELRVMGYNSPMVFGNRRYYEVQVPVQRMLADFARPVSDWEVVLDGVMGGQSSGTIQPSKGGAVFRGELSTENGGGFASARLALDHAAAAGMSELVLRVRGDGKRYKLDLFIDRAPGVAFRAPFNTTAGEWSEHRFTAADFEPVRRGRSVAVAEVFSIASVQQVGFLISDQQVGSFHLELGALTGQ